MPGSLFTPASARSGHAQRGSFLLEALIAVFIIAMGVLGTVGLISRSIQNVDESKYRAEAAALVATFVGNMWVDNRTHLVLKAKYEAGGAGYTELQQLVQQRLPNAVDPVVDIQPGLNASSDVTILVQWRPPGDAGLHQYQTFATIGANN